MQHFAAAVYACATLNTVLLFTSTCNVQTSLPTAQLLRGGSAGVYVVEITAVTCCNNEFACRCHMLVSRASETSQHPHILAQQV